MRPKGHGSTRKRGRFQAGRAGILCLLLAAGGCTLDEPPLEMARRAGQAALTAARHPGSWAPLPAALILGVTGLDRDISNWAADETPLFQSRSRAADASDVLRDGLNLAMAGSAFLAPPPPGRPAYWRRPAANLLAYTATHYATQGAKDAIGRERPDDSNDASMPSGHTSSAFVSAALIDQNFEGASWSPAASAALDVGTYGLAAATAWARIEAERHFPSDVLVGAALGNFIGRTFYLALVKDHAAPALLIEPRKDGFGLSWTQRF